MSAAIDSGQSFLEPKRDNQILDDESQKAMSALSAAGFNIDSASDFLEPDKAMIWATQNGNLAAVQLLLNKETDIEAKDNVGYTALHQAAIGGHEAVVATAAGERGGRRGQGQRGRDGPALGS